MHSLMHIKCILNAYTFSKDMRSCGRPMFVRQTCKARLDGMPP